MMPETSTAEKVVLYRCIKFPGEWEKQQTFLDGRKIVDIVVKEIKENEIQFLGSECSKDNDLMTKFCRFSLKHKEGMFIRICFRCKEAVRVFMVIPSLCLIAMK